MNKTELIVMLTWHDVTVENSRKIFLEAKDAPARYWGFKDVGLPIEEMRELVECMKENGKTTFMECLAHTEEETKRGMETALKCGFDILLGAHYFPETEKMASEEGLKHLPFVGRRENHALYGKVEDIAAEASFVCKQGVYGINLSGYRYQDGDPQELIRAVNRAIDRPLSIAGSVNTWKQIDFLKENGVRAFTIGGAFFEKKFGDTFAEQIRAVCDYLEK